ncbi:MAG TPA: flagellar hook-length control protein FliK [Acidimicrobiales bacterium]|nr:flagellar hook-length control protein FliK [Acidimicrobiales bacterium]
MRVALDSSEPTSPTSTPPPPPAVPGPSRSADDIASAPPFHQVLSEQGSPKASGASQKADSATPAKSGAAKEAKGAKIKARARDSAPADSPIVPVAPIQSPALVGSLAPNSATPPAGADTHTDVVASRESPASHDALGTPPAPSGGRAAPPATPQGPAHARRAVLSHEVAASTTPRDVQASTASATAEPTPSHSNVALGAATEGRRPAGAITVSLGALEPDQSRAGVPVPERPLSPRATGASTGTPTRTRVGADSPALRPVSPEPSSSGPLSQSDAPPTLVPDAVASRGERSATHATTLASTSARDARPARALASDSPGVSQFPAPPVGVGAVGEFTAISTVAPHAIDVGALAGAIARPLGDGQGTYSVLVAMHPADLGQLQALVTLHGNDLQVSIAPHTLAGHQALAGALHTLKGELSRGGMNVNVTLSDPSSQSREHHQPPRAASRAASLPGGELAVSPSAQPTHAVGQIHLIL